MLTRCEQPSLAISLSAWVLSVFLCSLPASGLANDEGDAAMGSSQYAEAIDIYQQEIASGPSSAALHFNIALAYTHEDGLGLAVYHLLQASFLEPWDNEIDESLAVVQRELERRRTEEEAVGESITSGEHTELLWLRFFHRFSTTAAEIAIILTSWLAFGLLFLRKSMKASVKRDAVTLISVLSLLGLLVTVAYRMGADITKSSTVPAVVTAQEPGLRAAPDREARRHRHPDLFGGALVLIRDQNVGHVQNSPAEWIEVELTDGSRGFLAASAVRVVEVD